MHTDCDNPLVYKADTLGQKFKFFIDFHHWNKSFDRAIWLIFMSCVEAEIQQFTKYCELVAQRCWKIDLTIHTIL